MNQAERDVQRKLRILKHANETGHVGRTCRYFGIGRASFYRWKAALEKHGEATADVEAHERAERHGLNTR